MGSGWRAPPPPCPHTPSPAEMDFAKGLQKIVQNCRQSVTQEVGNLGGVCGWVGHQAGFLPPGCEPQYLQDGPEERGFQSVQGWLREQGGGRASRRAPGPPPRDCDAGPTPQPHMPLLSIYSLALEQDLEFGHGLVQAVGTLLTQTFMQVGCAWEGGGMEGARVPTDTCLPQAPESTAART